MRGCFVTLRKPFSALILKDSFVTFVSGQAAKDLEKHREFLDIAILHYDNQVNLWGRQEIMLDHDMAMREKKKEKLDLDLQLAREQIKFYEKKNRQVIALCCICSAYFI